MAKKVKVAIAGVGNASVARNAAVPARKIAPAGAILCHFLPNNTRRELKANKDMTMESHIQIQLSTRETLNAGAAFVIDSRNPNWRDTK